MGTAYILENNLRVREVTIIKEIKDSCLIKLSDGCGFWIHKSRVYNNIGVACQEVRRYHPDLPFEKIVPRDIYVMEKYNAICNGL